MSDSPLFDFFASSFHQDWSEDAAHPDEVVDQFARDASGADVVVRTADLIDAMVSDITDDQALRGALIAAGSAYVPVDGHETRAWLTHVAERLRMSSLVKATLDWRHQASDFEFDGSLRDVVIMLPMATRYACAPRSSWSVPIGSAWSVTKRLRCPATTPYGDT